jgi:predicted MFS family arabinose efflux permease
MEPAVPASAAPAPSTFSSYQKGVVALLATLQFTIILDFMILSPLGAILMPALHISASQFGLVVSAYAFAAGAAGFLAAGFADRFDRKKLLILFYGGFVIGTLCCALAPSYQMLLLARTITGLFAGVVGSTVFAIITDLFPAQMRGRVMGIVQTAFAASQVLGIPLGLFLANHWGWHLPFVTIVVFGLGVVGVIVGFLRPVDEHLRLLEARSSPLRHLLHTVSQSRYLQGFATTALLATGGFMLMPFGSAFSVNNVGVAMGQLPIIYLVVGVSSIVVGPMIGRLNDRIGSLKTFAAGSSLSIVMCLVYTHLGVTPLWIFVFVNVVLFSSVSARMISSQALISQVPAPASRGAFMAVNSSVQQISGGLAAALAGAIVVAPPGKPLQHFEVIGYVIAGATFTTVVMMTALARRIAREKLA